VPFIDKNILAAIGFYYTNWNDAVRCAFCDVELGHWKEGDNGFKDQQRWSQSFKFISGPFNGNIPIVSADQPETTLPR